LKISTVLRALKGGDRLGEKCRWRVYQQWFAERQAQPDRLVKSTQADLPFEPLGQASAGERSKDVFLANRVACDKSISASIKFGWLSLFPSTRQPQRRFAMKTLTALIAASAFAITAGYVQAKDLGPDEALRLRDAGTIQSFEKLNAAALAKHPGATVTETELEQEYGKYVYQVELRDAKGVEWDVELDATNGQILKDHQDT